MDQRLTKHSAVAFVPPAYIANRHVQTLLNSSGLRRGLVQARTRAFRARAEQWIVDGGNGVRLLGYYNCQEHGEPRGLVVLFHGWEGSSDSNYILSTASRLYQSGYDIFRLNFRDHGASHHLNKEIFHSCRLDEVVNAVASVCGSIATRPVFLAGFSLGGNFALRVGLRAPAAGLPLKKIVAVCPVIVPGHVLDALEEGPEIYHHYFVRKWQNSLRQKQSCFPGLYDFSEWFKIKGLRDQTRYLVERFTDYSRIEDYLDGYALHSDRLASLSIPATIISTRDDPVIPHGDFENLVTPVRFTHRIMERGGHCSFIQNWRLESWIDTAIESELTAEPQDYGNA